MAQIPQAPEPIAIVGIGCRLPGGSNSARAFWELLRDGRDAITEIPPERWDLGQHFNADPQTPLHQHAIDHLALHATGAAGPSASLVGGPDRPLDYLL